MTRKVRPAGATGVLAILCVAKALAGDMDEAETHYANAQNQYVRELLKKPKANREELRAIRQRTLAPAEKQLNAVMTSNLGRALQKTGEPIREIPVDRTAPGETIKISKKSALQIEAFFGRAAGAVNTDLKSDDAGSKVPQRNTIEPSGAELPESPGLDGSQVKKELFFKNKTKKPAVSPTTQPTPKTKGLKPGGPGELIFDGPAPKVPVAPN